MTTSSGAGAAEAALSPANGKRMHLVGHHNFQSPFDRFSTFGMSKPVVAQIEVIAEAVVVRAVKYEDVLEIVRQLGFISLGHDEK